MKQVSTVLLACVILVLKMTTLSSCANIIPPQGGPRDSLPPVLVSAVPRDSAVNVFPKVATLVFNEYITLQSAYSNIIISPIPGTNFPPQIDYKLRTITIKFKDSLEKNTTYSINFGNAIQDVNESNIARNFVYAFSTGPKLDHNTYRGKIMMAETGKPADSSGLIVILHRNLDDTAVRKSDPRYYAVLNGKGEFTFNNLPDGKFAVYAVASRFTKKYTDSTDLFAFRDAPVDINANTPMDTLWAYEEVKRPPARSGPASAAVSVARTGSNRNQDTRLRYSVEGGSAPQDILGPLRLTFIRKLFAFDSTRIRLYDTNYNPVKDYSVRLDSGRLKLALQNNWKPGAEYRLIIAKDAVADSLGITLSKPDTLRFFAKKETDYGSLRIRFQNLDLSKNPVLQIVKEGVVIDSAALTTPDFQRKLFNPGNYEMRILFDRNKNNKWDPGHFPDPKRQPEVVFLITQPLAVRSNWDNDVNVVL